MKQKSSKITNIIVISLLVVGFASASGYYYYKFQKIKNDPEIAKQEEIKAITNKVRKLIALPEGNDLTIATIKDKDKLEGQNFFRNSENGDKILIYANAKKAILYRPSENKIIEVAPLLIGKNN